MVSYRRGRRCGVRCAAHALMLGVPAKRKGWVCECGTLLGAELACEDCGRAYRETDKGLEEVER